MTNVSDTVVLTGEQMDKLEATFAEMSAALNTLSVIGESIENSVELLRTVAEHPKAAETQLSAHSYIQVRLRALLSDADEVLFPENGLPDSRASSETPEAAGLTMIEGGYPAKSPS
jgi:hypothetical protein